VSAVAGLHVSAHSMRRTFTNIALKLGIEMWKVELLTSHVPTTTTLVHYTDTADLRETCAREIQELGDWVEAQAAIAARGRAWLRAA
jgi:integrase